MSQTSRSSAMTASTSTASDLSNGDDKLKKNKKPGFFRQRHKVLSLQAVEFLLPLLRAYPLKSKSLVFRTNYDHLLAKSYVWVPKSPGNFHEMLGVISRTVAFLGFEEASIATKKQTVYSSISQQAAELAENGLDLEDSRLSLLWIRPPEYSWNKLRNYIVYRQLDVLHRNIVNKWLLIKSLRENDQRIHFKTKDDSNFDSKYFLPETFNMGIEMDDLINQIANSKGTYIVKKVRGSKGQDIKLLRLRGGSNNYRDLLEQLKNSALLDQRLSNIIVQKYIEKPLLVDKRKFDFRVYMLIINASRPDKSEATFRKATYVYWHPGFLRLCIRAYQPDCGDLLCHLTNQHVQMTSVLYDEFKEATIWKPDELNKYFNNRGGLPTKDYVKKVIYSKIGAIVGYLGAVFLDSLNDYAIRASTFKIFGVDFIVDDHLSVQLLEVNELPSWSRQTKVLNSLKLDLWREAVAIAVETVVKFRQHQRLEPLVSRCNFRLAHSSEDSKFLSDSIARSF